MKKLLFLVLLAAITAPVYAGKNTKATPKSKALKPKLAQEQTAQPANDTAWHGTGKDNPSGLGEYDTSTRRYITVDPTTRSSLFLNNPYQGTTNKPIRAEDIKYIAPIKRPLKWRRKCTPEQYQ